jgi:hypothetical protein
MILIQHIETSWLKNERGGEAGTLRDKTPAALPVALDLAPGEATGIALHRVQLRRTRPGPEIHLAWLPPGDVTVGCVRVISREDGLKVVLEWTPARGGKPVRWQPGREPDWSILEGQWCQIRYNGRIDTDRTWRYHITTVNIGLFEQAQSDVFLSKPHIHRREDLVYLL